MFIVFTSYTFPEGTKTPRLVVDLTNDGQKSSTDPVMDLDPDTARVTGQSFSTCLQHVTCSQGNTGGASFAGSFGPGRYRAFTCVDFKGDGYTLV